MAGIIVERVAGEMVCGFRGLPGMLGFYFSRLSKARKKIRIRIEEERDVEMEGDLRSCWKVCFL